eukprot:TRINITY_DN1826_c0_g1_i1.p1 TRINITY_DN1826_c0_g1~~TRINITY_DN1826_c0_g1_i1.p1  ORF type:complete len:458 (+),score=57.30 TRINITY_DN1826_c0_g1_i1:43-1374(+)
MQVFVSFPGSEFPAVVFEAVAESLVADVIQSAADEWGTDADFLVLSFNGNLIPSGSRVFSHGVVGGSELTTSLLQVFNAEWFTDDAKREKLMKHLSRSGERHLSLDTPSFATRGCFQFDMWWVPDGIEISFINPHPSITSAEFQEPYIDIDSSEDFGAFHVSKIDLSGLESITSTGNAFLLRCESITTLDVCLSALTTVGDRFLFACTALTSLDLTSLNNVSVVGSSFLYACSSLTALDLSVFNKVTVIGNSFLVGCSSLSALDLSGFNNVTTIGDAFLARCSSLLTVDLSVFNNVTEIGSSFLAGCSSLSKLDLTALSNITTLCPFFLDGCSSLSTLDLDFDNLTTIGNAFLESCTSLKKVDLTSFSNVTEISSPMLEWCTSLCEVHVTSLESINFSPRTLRGCSRIWVGGERASSKIIKEAIAKWVEVGEEVSLSEELSEN